MKSTKYNASNIKCQISFLPRPVTKLFLYIKDISESEGSHVGVYIRSPLELFKIYILQTHILN